MLDKMDRIKTEKKKKKKKEIKRRNGHEKKMGRRKGKERKETLVLRSRSKNKKQKTRIFYLGLPASRCGFVSHRCR